MNDSREFAGRPPRSMPAPSTPQSSPSSPDRPNAWNALERAVADLTQAIRSQVEPSAFYSQWLERIVECLAADGACLWQTGEDATSTLAQVTFPAELLSTPADALRSRLDEHRQAALAGHLAVVVDRPDGATLLADVLPQDASHELLVEIYFRQRLAREVAAGAIRMLRLFHDVAVDFQQSNARRVWQRDVDESRVFEELLRRIHGQLDPEATAYIIANESRRWLECDRVTVLERTGQLARTLAVSGVDRIDRRSEELRRLEQLAAVVAAGRQTLRWQAGASQELAPEVENSLQEYVDRSHSRQLTVLPLEFRHGSRDAAETADIVGLVVVESFHEGGSADVVERKLARLAPHAASALGIALEHARLPGRSVLALAGRFVRAVRRRPLAVSLSLGAALLVTAFLALYPAQLTVTSQGTLQPKQRRHVFAPLEAVVEQIHVAHGSVVEEGQELLTLHSDRVELDVTRLRGEEQTLRARLAAVRTRRASRATRDEPRENLRDEERQLAADEEQLKRQLEGLEKQLTLVERLRGELRVVSPLAGTVLTWNVEDQLRDRPVRQGQRLLTVADPTGDWVLELRVPDAALGYLLDGQRRGGAELPVRFFLATDPARTWHGQVARVSLDSDAVDSDLSAARVEVRLDGASVPDRRAGAGVSARIDCGSRAIGYVWLHELIDTVRTWWW